MVKNCWVTSPLVLYVAQIMYGQRQYGATGKTMVQLVFMQELIGAMPDTTWLPLAEQMTLRHVIQNREMFEIELHP